MRKKAAEDRIERLKVAAKEKELGREAALAEKRQSVFLMSQNLEEKRAAKLLANATKNERQRAEQQRKVELRRLKRMVRVDAVQRLRRQREYESLVKSENFEEKNQRAMALLGAYFTSVSKLSTREKSTNSCVQRPKSI